MPDKLLNAEYPFMGNRSNTGLRSLRSLRTVRKWCVLRSVRKLRFLRKRVWRPPPLNELFAE